MAKNAAHSMKLSRAMLKIPVLSPKQPPMEDRIRGTARRRAAAMVMVPSKIESIIPPPPSS